MNFRTTLIIFILFALSAAGYFLFWDGDAKENSSTTDQPRISEVYGLSADTVQRIRLSFKDSSFHPLALARDGNGEWRLTDPITTYANEGKVSEMLEDLLNKRVKRILEVEEFTPYGLDQPNIQVSLQTANDTQATSFLIGNKTVNYSVYAKEASESHIFLIESSALQDLTKSPADLRTRDVLKFEPGDVTGFTLTVAGAELIRCQRKGEAGWQMAAPINVKADAKEIRSVLDAVHLLKVAEFTKDGDVNLAEYGLDIPRIRLTLQLGDESQELLVGSDIQNTARVYVKPIAFDAVYAANKEIYAALNKSVFDLRDKRVIDFQRTATNRFEIERQGEEKIVCAKDLQGVWQIEEPVALKADAEVVADLLFGVDALKATEFVAEQPKSLKRYGLDFPSLKISFFTPDAEPAVLLLGKIKGDKLYAKAENATRVVLVRRDLPEFVGLGVAGLRHKQVLRFESDDAFKLTLRHGGVQLTCQKQGVNWRLVSPVQEDAKNRAVNSIIYRLNDLKAEAYLASAPNISITRLNKPEAQVAVTLENLKEYTLQIGAANENTLRYARLRAAPNTVFLLEPSILDELRITVADLRVSPERSVNVAGSIK